MDFQLKNKNVLVTAASAGIGKAIAELFLKEGCNVAICSSNIKRLEKTSDELEILIGGKLFYTKCDINNLDEIEDTVQAI